MQLLEMLDFRSRLLYYIFIHCWQRCLLGEFRQQKADKNNVASLRETYGLVEITTEGYNANFQRNESMSFGIGTTAIDFYTEHSTLETAFHIVSFQIILRTYLRQIPEGYLHGKALRFKSI